MKIAFLGDIALFGRNTIKNTAYHQIFEPVKRILEQYDFVVANLESPLTNQIKTIGGKSAYLKGDVNDVELLKYLNVTHVTLANNHMYDYRAQGLNDTIQVLEANKIKWYGVNNRSEFINDGETYVQLMGYCCYSTNGKGLNCQTPYINALDPQEINNAISKSLSNNMFPVLSFHWGEEHVHYPNYDHIELARKLCTGRNMLIHGHHPHVIQGLEKINGSLIAYSLGNFCFDDVYTKKSKQPLVKLSNDNQESFILIVTFEKNIICNYEIVPFSFKGATYQIDYDIMDKIQSCSLFFNTPKEEYIRKRAEELGVYINKRKKMRNMEWYLKRLNLESIGILWESKKNRKKYNSLIKSYICK